MRRVIARLVFGGSLGGVHGGLLEQVQGPRAAREGGGVEKGDGVEGFALESSVDHIEVIGF